MLVNEISKEGVGNVVKEGESKIVYLSTDHPGYVVLYSKTYGDDVAHDRTREAEASTITTTTIFNLLENAGIKTHYEKCINETTVLAKYCDMIPLEWVSLRVATGPFLERNPGVTAGYRFSSPKLEVFSKDDKNHDLKLWSYNEWDVAKRIIAGNRVITRNELDIMSRTTTTVFEILEKAWSSLDCSLIGIKIEFGVDRETGQIILADVIDSNSCCLIDKEVCRNLLAFDGESLKTANCSSEWVADRVKFLSPLPNARVVVFMGSPTDSEHCANIQKACKSYGVPCELRVASADNGTDETLNMLAEYEGAGIPTVFIAVAGRSNGLGPLLSGNTSWPVINCPPIGGDWGSHDIWSSLRLPSGLGCTTVTSPDGAALAAAQILGLHDHVIWAKLRTKQLNTWIDLKIADQNKKDEMSVD